MGHKAFAAFAGVAGIALVFYGRKLLARFNEGPKTFHGNPVNDPFMIKRGAASLLILFGAWLILVVAPIVWIKN